MSGYYGRAGVLILAGLLIACAAAGARALEPEPVTFPAADGMQIAADYYAPDRKPTERAPMVILLHMYRSDRKAWQPLVAPLHDAGFAILALDLRGHGESATTETRDRVHARDGRLFREMQADVRGAYDWLASRPEIDRARFALVGASVGGSIALQYAVVDRSVDALVWLSPGINYLDIDSAGDLAQIRGRRILMLATEDERDAPYTLQQRGQGVELHVFDGQKAHGTDMLGKISEVEQRIVRFLKTGIGRPSKTVVFGTINSNIYHPPDSGWIGEIAPTNLRHYSSPQEAEARGLRAARSRGPRHKKS